MKVVLFVLMLAMLCGVASCTTYCVSTAGNDTFDGLSWSTALKTIEASTAKADTPGDTVEIADGNYGHEHIVIDYAGNATDYITFRKYNGTVVIDGVDDNGHGFDIVGKSYIIIEGFNITNYSTGIHVTGHSDHVIIRHNAFYANYFKAMRTESGSNYTTFSYNDVSDHDYPAVAMCAGYGNCTFNNFHDIGFAGVAMDGCPFNRFNTINNNTFTSIERYGIVSCYGGSDWSAANNIMTNIGRCGFSICASERIRLTNNTISPGGSYGDYRVYDGGPGGTLKVKDVIITPPVGTAKIMTGIDTPSQSKIKFPDNRLFWENSTNLVYAYPNRTEMRLYGSETFTITVYNATVVPTGNLSINITTFTPQVKRYNESAASDMYAFFTVGEGAANTTYVVNIFADANGSKMQTFRIKSNTTGYIKYNTTGYGYDRWTEIKPATEAPGTLVVIAVCGAVLFGGGWAIRRWVKKS